MAEITSCPSCQRKLQVPESLNGQDVQCPTCGATFIARISGEVPNRASPRPPDRWEERGGDRPRRRHGRDELDHAVDDDDEYQEGNPRRRRDVSPHRGGMILTLGILGFCVGVTGPVAWILGNIDIAAIRAGTMDRDGESMTQAGRVCGIVSTIWVFVQIGFCCLAFGMGAR